MNCLKCGREIRDGNVFCESCKLVMEKHPVNPGASLQLPRRPEREQVKKPTPKKRQGPPEETVKRQKKIIRRMALVIAICFVLICVLAGRIAGLYMEKRQDDLPSGSDTSQTEQ